MENFIVSARKYRPDTFQTVVGQTSITSTLKNAIKNGQLAHAYLFCGPRGVGKTTCARIFAKTINCQNLTEEIEPCNQCESCKAFNSSRSYNIHELDAASNNSVDGIRSLTDQVRIPPQIGKYSIYIIDEVHMLSQAAFNAFLKTLEEPPKHAIFILATTEKHKIIPTILSRCQIFDFNRIRVSDISSHLEYVAKKEEIEIEKEALNVIAHKADGAMRDALSVFDQIVSFSGKNITYKDVIANLNVLDYDYYFKLIDILLKNDISGALMIFNEVLDNGFDGHHFISGLSDHLRDLLVCKDSVTVQLLEVGGEIKEKYKSQASACNASFLLDALQLSNECDLQYKQSQNKRLLVELALIKMAQLTLKKKSDDESESDELAPFFNKTDSKQKTQQISGEPDIKYSQQKENNNTSNIPVKKVIRKTGSSYTPSIKDALSGKKKEDKTDAKTRLKVYSGQEMNDPFTLEQFKSKWDEYLERLSDRPILKVTLSRTPEIIDGSKLKLNVDNNLLDEEISKIKPDLVSWLRKELKNTNIELITEVILQENQSKPYSEKEILAEMVKKNPTINQLKQIFKLDLGENM